jgi:ATP-dependent protease ClpP protease subunit
MEDSKRYVYHFDNPIDWESVQELIDILSQHEKIDLFFTTEGGEIAEVRVLIHYLNTRKDDIDIYLTDVIMSAGTFLLTDYHGKIILTESLDCILFHKTDRQVYTRRQQFVSIPILLEQLDNDNELMAKKFLDLGLTKSEIKEYKEGKDVVLYRKDFNRLNINKKWTNTKKKK